MIITNIAELSFGIINFFTTPLSIFDATAAILKKSKSPIEVRHLFVSIGLKRSSN